MPSKNIDFECLIEKIRQAPDGVAYSLINDIKRIIAQGGRERSLTEMRAILGQAENKLP